MSRFGHHGSFNSTAPGTPTTDQFALGAPSPFDNTPQHVGGNNSRHPHSSPSQMAATHAQRLDPVIDPRLQAPPTDSEVGPQRTPAKSLAEKVKDRNKTKKRESENCFTADGRGYGRWHDAMSSYTTTICNGSILDPDRRQLDDDELVLFKKWRRLIEVLPYIEGEVARQDNAGKMQIAKFLDMGRQFARSEDNAKVKDAIAEFYDFGGNLPKKTKRGFYHLVCAKLIGPYGVDMDDPIVREMYKDKKLVLKSGDLSLFLYENETIDPNDIVYGLFRGIILLKVGLLIAYGKAAARAEDPSERRAGGIAEIHGQFEVTIEYIAYCAVLAHFALTSSRTLYMDGRGSFKYSEYYDAIIVIFNRRSELWRDQLIRFWNNYIYGERAYNVEQAIAEGNERFSEKSLASMLFQLPVGVE